MSKKIQKSRKLKKIIIFCPKKPNRTETGRFEPVSIRFWFFIKKNNKTEIFFKKKTETGSNRFDSVFQFGSVFSGFFSVLVQFFRFQTYKTETEPNQSVF